MVICKTIGLNKTYIKDNEEINSIIDCNFEIGRGECVAICGEKASGKTTLLNILAGLERPTTGKVYINNNDITSCYLDELATIRSKEIGFLYQKDRLIPELNVHENIIIPSLLANIKYDEFYYRNLIHSLDLNEILNLYPKQLSDYQQKSVMYARSLINNPNIILLDESFDDTHPKVLDCLLCMVYQYYKTLIMVTNKPDFMYIDHIIRLDHGQVVEDRRIS